MCEFIEVIYLDVDLGKSFKKIRFPPLSFEETKRIKRHSLAQCIQDAPVHPHRLSPSFEKTRIATRSRCEGSSEMRLSDITASSQLEFCVVSVPFELPIYELCVSHFSDISCV